MVVYFLCFSFSFSGDEAADKKISNDPTELILDGGFTVPEANAFGHTFR